MTDTRPRDALDIALDLDLGADDGATLDDIAADALALAGPATPSPLLLAILTGAPLPSLTVAAIVAEEIR